VVTGFLAVILLTGAGLGVRETQTGRVVWSAYDDEQEISIARVRTADGRTFEAPVDTDRLMALTHGENVGVYRTHRWFRDPTPWRIE
jgi:hypothetical protein